MSKFKAFGGVGHGGSDSGAVGNGLRESDINLVQALAWEKEMKRHGVEVKLSRYKDENDNINEEVRECNSFNPDIAVDFHTNSGGGDGCEFIHSVFGSDSKRLASCINEEVVKLGQNTRGLKTRKRNDGRDYFAFVRDTKCPAVISECAFIDNSNDISIVDTKAEQEAYGIAVAKGCLKYLGIPYKENTDNQIYKIITGGFGSKENAEAKANLLKSLTGWFLEVKEVEGHPGDFCIHTGGFTGVSKVEKKMNALIELTGWWCTYIKE